MRVSEEIVRRGAIALWESEYDCANWPRLVLESMARLVLEAAGWDRKCPLCGAPFKQEHGRQIYCTKTCAGRARGRRHYAKVNGDDS